MSEDDTDRSVVWQYGPAEQQHIRDANRADDRPDNLTFDVDGGEVIATGSAESLRWLYDYLHYLKRAWRNEGEQWDADAAEEMAESLYEQVDGDLPERQRNKKVMTDGGQVEDDAERFGPGWFVIEQFHQDPARVVSGPKDRESAESHAHFLTDPNARIMHTPALVNAIQNDGYNVEWSERADKPAALKRGESA